MAKVFQFAVAPMKIDPKANAFDRLADRVVYQLKSVGYNIAEGQMLRAVDINIIMMNGYIEAGLPPGHQKYVDLLNDTNEIIDEFTHRTGASSEAVREGIPAYWRLRKMSVPETPMFSNLLKAIARLGALILVLLAMNHWVFHIPLPHLKGN